MTVPTAPLQVFTLAERPDLAERLNDFPEAVAEFLYHDAISVVLYDEVILRYPEFMLMAVDPAEPDVPVAKMCSLPFSWDGDPHRDLPAGGYDDVVLSAAGNRLGDRPGNLVSAVEAMVQPGLRGQGISHVMLAAMRRNAARLGFRGLVAPVRPNGKHRYPEMSMEEYAGAVRSGRRGGDVRGAQRVGASSTRCLASPTFRGVASPGTSKTWNPSGETRTPTTRYPASGRRTTTVTATGVVGSTRGSPLCNGPACGTR
jgi:hypothetical protein